MAQETKFLVKGYDLNTIFAPISINNYAYGFLNKDGNIGETWVNFDNIVIDSNNTIISSVTNNKGFQIINAGLYKLNVTLNFDQGNEEGQLPVFILSSSDSVPLEGSYVFTPSPTLSQIYAINCSGAFNTDNGSAVNTLNNVNLGNLFALYDDNGGTIRSVDNMPYFFAFRTGRVSSGVGNIRPNFFTLDVTFTATPGQVIYPYIRCKASSASPYVTIAENTSKWMFTRIN